MKSAGLVLVGLVLSVTLTGCGGGDSEADAREGLKDLGVPDKLTDCVVAGIKKEADSLAKFTRLDASKQEALAAEAGENCADELSDEEIDDLTDGLGFEDMGLDDPSYREEFIDHVSGDGVTREAAACMLDKMIEDRLSMADIDDPEIMDAIAAACV